jgi:hypothetical protein
MPPVEFEPTIPASERPQTHALDRFSVKLISYIFFLSFVAETSDVLTAV